MLLVVDVLKIIQVGGWISLALILFFILYRRLLKKIKGQTLLEKNFVRLEPLHEEKVNGTIQFFFTADVDKEVLFRIYDAKEVHSIVLKDEVVKKGGHVVNFDTTQLPNGVYFYEIKTPNQKSSKVVEIEN